MLQFIQDWQNGRAARLAESKKKAINRELREKEVGEQLANAKTADDFLMAVANIEGHFLLEGPCGKDALFAKARQLTGVNEPF